MIERIGRIAGAVFLIGMGVLALTAACTLFWAIWPQGWKGDGPAAWVQAVGSVAGIGIAVYIPWKQRKDAVRLERAMYVRARTDAVEKLDYVAFDINVWLASGSTISRRVVWNDPMFQIGRAQGEELRARLFKFHDLPFSDLEPFVFQLRSTVEEAMLFLGPSECITIPLDDESKRTPFRKLQGSVHRTRQDMDNYRDRGLAILHRLDPQGGTSLARPYESNSQ